MKKIILDLCLINTSDLLHDFLEKELKLSQYIKGGCGRNLNAFWDAYSYSKDNEFFELKNYHKIKDGKYKIYVDYFIDVLEKFKGFEDNGKWIVPNPNFDYKIVS